jgi:hypothetical protein
VTVCGKRHPAMICTIGPAHYAQAAPLSKVMSDIVRLFAQIALLRRGPQDLPASALLLVLTVGGYVCVNLVLCSLLPPSGGWPAQLALDVLFTLVWYFALLRLAGRAERFLQTATAVFGFQAVLSPLLIASAWLWRRYWQDSTWQLPVLAVALVLLAWLIAANSRVVKAALEWPNGASVALVIAQIAVGEWLVLALLPSGS